MNEAKSEKIRYPVSDGAAANFMRVVVSCDKDPQNPIYAAAITSELGIAEGTSSHIVARLTGINYIKKGEPVKIGPWKPVIPILSTEEFWQRVGGVREMAESDLDEDARYIYDTAIKSLAAMGEPAERKDYLQLRSAYLGGSQVLSEEYDSSLYEGWFSGAEGWRLLITCVRRILDQQTELPNNQ